MAAKRKLNLGSLSDTVKNLSEKAADASRDAAVQLGLSKERASIRKDVEDAAKWAAQRIQEIKNGAVQVRANSLPTLAKVVFGGKDGIGLLTKEDQENYRSFFKANGKRLALLTIINPAVGIGLTGIELVSSGIVTEDMANTALLTGAGMTAASFFTVSSVLGPLGLGLVAVGTGARIISNSENSAVGKQLEKVFAESQNCWKEVYDQFAISTKEIEEILLNKLSGFIAAVEDAGRKAAITIDDVIHSDQNLRLMEYQEILLKQQSDVAEQRKQFEKLIERYNAEVRINNELARKLAAFEANKQFVACAAEYLK